MIYCKDETGSIVPWTHTQDAIFQPWRHVHYNEGESPLSRIAELFNVNHFIVSQARPYLIPFVCTELTPYDRDQTGITHLTRSCTRLILSELRHRLRQLDYLGLLPTSISRLLMDETIPVPNLTLVPDLSCRDLISLFRDPTSQRMAEWTRKGERGVWPAVSALKVREAVEIELDRGYQLVRRRRPSDLSVPPAWASAPRLNQNEDIPRQRLGYGQNDGEAAGVSDAE
jgi:TAG lipase/lysophosphatidylethanolamine acyltransferase